MNILIAANYRDDYLADFDVTLKPDRRPLLPASMIDAMCPLLRYVYPGLPSEQASLLTDGIQEACG